ncbi:MAG: response regulator transcription factor [Candidatus Dormibacteraeota bacterium]|uniref:Response regulator transcription factor n=1 Tax=Candidatus Amunia macphersoniae TaxID=3127014 RepID=A0A934KG50_9BACT|nr:response regulator transcription factor [Candidatus Dormibacteraeota bacterium]
MRVLLVEDDARLAGTVRRGLHEVGISVDIAGDGLDGLAAARGTPFDVVVLDGMLPGMDGFQVCRELRSASVRVPILMLTGRDSIDDRIAGLSAGADDYLVKPFAFAELLARIRALTRRHLDNRSALLEAGEVRLDTDARTVTVAGRTVEFTAKELSILEYFLHNPNRVLTRRQIEDHVWNYDFSSESNLVEVYIGRLRRKLGAEGVSDLIQTLRGTGGYRLTCPTP